MRQPYWGPVTGSSIIGKVVLTWWHDDHPDFHGVLIPGRCRSHRTS